MEKTSLDGVESVVSTEGMYSCAILVVDFYVSFSYAVFCRGFCGTRTLPFTEPIQVGKETDGLYIMCRLTSDDEPERRVWKVTTRSEQSRGEQLYQAMFELPAKKEEWTRIEIPFSSFVQVRGPRIVDGAPSLNVTKGIYQIGISLSKFMLSKNVTEIANFRPGFFELQIKEIGIYLKGEDEVSVTIPATLTKTEAANNRPILLKLLLPLAKMFFDEKRYEICRSASF